MTALTDARTRQREIAEDSVLCGYDRHGAPIISSWKEIKSLDLRSLIGELRGAKKKSRNDGSIISIE
jgi:hypothetical protein